jgi:hypothetical protein
MNQTPASVVTALRGPKKDYVGAWHGKAGDDLTVTATGDFDADLKGTDYEHLNITAFDGDDIICGALRIKVTRAPRRVGEHFEMVANDVRLERR